MASKLFSNNVTLIGFGILLGLLFALILYLFFENRELKQVNNNQQNEVETVDQDSNIKDSSASNDSEIMIDDVEKDASSEKDETSNQSLWLATKKINTFDGYLEFIKSSDNDGTHNQECISKLFKVGTSGWLYSGRTNDESTYSGDQMVRVTWRKDNDRNTRLSLPKNGDIVSLISKESRRTYPDFLPRDRQNGVWPLGRSAYVLDSRIEGKTALIIKVVYK